MSAEESKEHPKSELPPEYSPKDTFVAEIAAPESRLTEFSIDFKSDTPGNIRAVADILEKHRVNILSGSHEPARWSFFADVSHSDVGRSQLIQELSNDSHIKKIQTQDGHNGVIVDALHHPLMMGKNRAILFRLDTIGSVFSRPRQIFGAEGQMGKVLLHQMGRAGGQSSIKAFLESMGKDNIREQLSNIMNMYTAGGWGIFKLTEADFDLGVAVVQAFENFECMTHQGEGGEPYSQYVRGDLAGLFSEIFHRKVDAIETQCVVQGAPFCRFEIAPPTKDTTQSS